MIAVGIPLLAVGQARYGKVVASSDREWGPSLGSSSGPTLFVGVTSASLRGSF